MVGAGSGLVCTESLFAAYSEAIHCLLLVSLIQLFFCCQTFPPITSEIDKDLCTCQHSFMSSKSQVKEMLFGSQRRLCYFWLSRTALFTTICAPSLIPVGLINFVKFLCDPVPLPSCTDFTYKHSTYLAHSVWLHFLLRATPPNWLSSIQRNIPPFHYQSLLH